MRKYLIVGIDPGTTSGLAILGLEGEVLEINSFRDISLNELTQKVVETGNPILVSTDVSPAPDSLKQLSTMLDAKLWKPSKSLSKEEKRNLTKNYQTDDEHQLDALAASLKGYRFAKSRLKSIKNRSPKELDNHELLKLVLEGKSLRKAIDELRGEEETSSKENEASNLRTKDKKIVSLEKKIKKLQDRIKDLKEINKRKEKDIKDLKKELSRIKSRRFLEAIESSEIKDRDKKIQSLKKELSKKEEELKELSKLVSVSDQIDSYREREDKLVLKRVSSFTKNDIDELDEHLGIEEGDILYIDDASGGGSKTAERIADRVRGLVINDNLSHMAEEIFVDEGVPCIEASEIDLEYFENYVVANKNKLEKLINEKEEKLANLKKEEFKSKYGF